MDTRVSNGSPTVRGLCSTDTTEVRCCDGSGAALELDCPANIDGTSSMNIVAAIIRVCLVMMGSYRGNAITYSPRAVELRCAFTTHRLPSSLVATTTDPVPEMSSAGGKGADARQNCAINNSAMTQATS